MSGIFGGVQLDAAESVQPGIAYRQSLFTVADESKLRVVAPKVVCMTMQPKILNLHGSLASMVAAGR